MSETVHACPSDGQAVTPCCGRTPFELPRTDRMTQDPGGVTCNAEASLTERLISHTGHAVRHPWPALLFVQGGDSGVVFAGDKTYRTAFVEAFPEGTFLRGEGATVHEAEDKCWEQYQRFVRCDGTQPGTYAAHGPFERRSYRNGAGYCTRCGIWMSQVFEELPAEEKPPGERRLIDRVFVDQDRAAIAEVLHLTAHADELPAGPPRDINDKETPDA